jgi:hypothetical protein
MRQSALHHFTSGYVTGLYHDFKLNCLQNQSTPIVLVRDSYEAIVLTAFFYLLLTYLSDHPEEQKRIFLKKGLSREADHIATQRGVPVEKWCFPLGFIKWKPSVSSQYRYLFFCETQHHPAQDGLYFLQLMKWAVLQYCVIRPTLVMLAIHWTTY